MIELHTHMPHNPSCWGAILQSTGGWHVLIQGATFPCQMSRCLVQHCSRCSRVCMVLGGYTGMSSQPIFASHGIHCPDWMPPMCTRAMVCMAMVVRVVVMHACVRVCLCECLLVSTQSHLMCIPPIAESLMSHVSSPMYHRQHQPQDTGAPLILDWHVSIWMSTATHTKHVLMLPLGDPVRMHLCMHTGRQTWGGGMICGLGTTCWYEALSGTLVRLLGVGVWCFVLSVLGLATCVVRMCTSNGTHTYVCVQKQPLTPTHTNTHTNIPIIRRWSCGWGDYHGESLSV